jgi:DNA invertase Pin-like site-specific DNA recombinase
LTASPKGQRIGYVRVSTVEQNTSRQLDGIHLDRTFTDKASGSSTDRPQLSEALAYLRAGDTLVVHSMDRLARNLSDLLALMEDLTGRGVTVEFVKERQTFKPGDADPFAKLMLQMLGAFAEFERSLIRERQREGIELAKVEGKYRGRAPRLTPEQASALVAKDTAQLGKGRAALAREFGISRETLYQYLGKAGASPSQGGQR